MAERNMIAEASSPITVSASGRLLAGPRSVATSLRGAPKLSLFFNLHLHYLGNLPGAMDNTP